MASGGSSFDREESYAFHRQLQTAIAASIDEYAFQLQLQEALDVSEFAYATDPRQQHGFPAAIPGLGYPLVDCVEAGIAPGGVMGASTSADNSGASTSAVVQNDQCGNGAAEPSSHADLPDAREFIGNFPGAAVEEETIKGRDGWQREGKRPIVDTASNPGVSSAVSKPVFNPESRSTVEVCLICLQPKASTEIFEVMHCLHRFCIPCLTQHVHRSLEDENKKPYILCAEAHCGRRLTPDDCKVFLPNKYYDKWKERLSEPEIREAKKLYCPFPDCAAMLVMPTLPLSEGLESEVICSTECPFCIRLFCIRCLVPWHSNLSCFDYQGLPGVQQKERNNSGLFWTMRSLSALSEL